MSKTAFLILTTRATPALAAFADDLAGHLPNVMIVADLPDGCETRRAVTVHIADEEARAAGYVHSSPLIAKTPISWDKALYLAHREDFDHTWYCEDDVLFVDTAAALALVARHAEDETDLLCGNYFTLAQKPHWMHWGYAKDFSDRHKAGSFLPVCRVSRALANAVHAYVVHSGALSFIETMLPSLANQQGLRTKMIPGLTRLNFRAVPPFNTPAEILGRYALFGRTVFHPVKTEALRTGVLQRYREIAASWPARARTAILLPFAKYLS